MAKYLDMEADVIVTLSAQVGNNSKTEVKEEKPTDVEASKT